MPPDSASTCVSLDLSLPPLPPRSRLYSLEPVGLGTGLVESQTSYVARVAQAHHLTCAVLFGWELAHFYGRPSIREMARGKKKAMILASSFSYAARAMNSTGVTARNWVETLEVATGRSDLRATTMLAWGEVISHQRLLRGVRAWCPSCYEEWLHGGRTVYEPLIWALEAVTACTRHRRRLREKCQHCLRHQSHLASHSRPGFCHACKEWLGEAEDVTVPGDELLTDAEFERQSWVSAKVGEMLAAAPQLACKPAKEVVARSTSLCVEQATTRGTILSFSRAQGIPKQTVAKWCRGDSVPQLGRLLEFCVGIGVPPLDFTTGTLDPMSGVRWKTREPILPTVPPTHPRRRSKIDRESVGRDLRKALREEPPPSMVVVARRLGRTTGGLRYQFPKLCRAIVVRYQERQRSSRIGNWDGAERALKGALDDESHPSVADVARQLGWNFTRLCRRFPQLCKQVSECHKRYVKVIWSNVGSALRGILKEHPAPPMRVIVERIGRCEASLYTHFPDLCRRLTARHLKFRQQSFEECRKSFQDDIRQAVLSLHAEGVYPTVKRVQERLKSPKSLRSSRPGLEALRQLKKELNLEEKYFLNQIVGEG